MKIKNVIVLLFLGVLISGKGVFSSPAYAQQTLTAGVVQKCIYTGVTQDQVVVALGSPNIVTQDADGKETWIYDKMSSSYTDKNKNESAIKKATFVRDTWHNLGMFLTLGLLVKGDPEMTEVSQIETSQSTLTIIIKFDKTHKVESFSYHSSKF